MFRSQGQESTAFRRQRSSRTGRALVLETKHKRHYTHYPQRGQTAAKGPLSAPKSANLAGKLGTNQRCARRQRLQFGASELARQRHHAAIGAGLETVGRNEGERRAQGCRHLLGGFHLVGRDVDGPDQYVLSRKKAQKLERDSRVGAFERNLTDRRLRQQREGLLVLPPLRAEGGFPVDIGFDAVAVTDMDRGTAFEPLGGTLEGGDAPGPHFVEIDVERRLIELDHVDPSGLDGTRLFIEDFRKSPGELFPASGVVVVKGVDHGHRSRQGEFHPAPGLAAQEMGVVDIDWMRSRDGSDDDRDIGIVTVANADAFLVLEIDTLEVLDQGGDEVPAGLLAVGDNVDARALLIKQGEPYRVALALGELVAFE